MSTSEMIDAETAAPSSPQDSGPDAADAGTGAGAGGDLVEQALGRVRDRLAEMRRSGRLPDFSRGELDRQFGGVVESVEAQLAEIGPVPTDRLRGAARLGPDVEVYASGLPGGAAFRKVLARVRRRTTAAVGGDFTRATVEAVDDLATRQRLMQDLVLRIHLDRLRAMEYRIAELELEVSRLRAGTGDDPA